MNAIELAGVDVVHGDAPARAWPWIDRGLSRDDILARTGQLVAVRGISLAVEAGQICVLMGLSGSGKSTLLRTMNGLCRPGRGRVTVRCSAGTFHPGDGDRARLQALRRGGVGMVFQQDALMPWLSVRENVAFGAGPGAGPAQIDPVLEQVGLGRWATALPGQLSGGMRQRVGLARALASRSEILLMDEPFSALDPLVRSRLQDELLGLQRQTGKTIVFVSHDPDEALKLGDRVAILRDGVLEQYGPPSALLLRPASDYVARFVSGSHALASLAAASLMTPWEPGRTRQALEEGWLLTGPAGHPRAWEVQGRPLGLPHWRPGQSAEVLGSRPVLVPADIGLRDAAGIMLRTGKALVLLQDGKVCGTLGREAVASVLGVMPGTVSAPAVSR